jgi:hypothetical protein
MHRDILHYWVMLGQLYQAGFRWVVCVACVGEIRNVYQILYR